MKPFKTLPFLVAVCLCCLLPASMRSQEVNKYWVRLRDKAGTPHSLSNPSTFLSPRALERRSRQHIALDSLDLPVSEAYLDSLRHVGFVVQNRSKWLNGVTLFAPNDSLLPQLSAFPFVDTVILCERSPLAPPSLSPIGAGMPYSPRPFRRLFDPDYYAFAYPQVSQLHGDVLHRQGFQGQGVVIGVCDGGFPGVDTSRFFDSLYADGRLFASRDFVWGGTDVFSVNAHGTKVFSLMASNLPGFFVGTAPKASYVLCRTEDTERETILEEYNWIAAAEYLDSLGADIITTSLGYFHFDDSTQDHTLADLDGRSTPMSIAADIAVSRGMLVLVAAGNDGLEGQGRLNSPADAPLALTVGSVDANGFHSPFSSYGPTADRRIKPDVMALGQEVYGATCEGTLSRASGTSLATPVMAGMMACLWQRFPFLTPSQLCDSVRAWGSNAHNVIVTNGYGIPDFSRALRFDTLPDPLSSAAPAPASSSQSLFWLSPNPCRQHVDITLSAASASNGAVAVLRDAMGRVLQRAALSGSPARLSLGSLPAGLYFLTVATPVGSHTQRLLVQ